MTPAARELLMFLAEVVEEALARATDGHLHKVAGCYLRSSQISLCIEHRRATIEREETDTQTRRLK